MISNIKMKKYNKKLPYSYTLGAFPTIELLKKYPKKVMKVFTHSDLNSVTQEEIITGICNANNIFFECNDRIVEKLRDKENCFVIGVFKKYNNELDKDSNHVVLVNPSDMGNMGTIIRTCVGFGIKNLAVIEPAVDIFNPKVVRASMGAVFHVNICRYDSFDTYYAIYKESHDMFPFMLNGAKALQDYEIEMKVDRAFSLIFGNEATGLPDTYSEIGQSILINYLHEVDSLNLSIATGIGLYEFTKKYFKQFVST